MYYKTTYTSPVGLITLACDGDNIIGVWNEGQKYHGANVSEEMLVKEDIPVLEAAKKMAGQIFCR
jgi:methylated-DNA-[protein]-cysteine S-methyltransferase